MVSDVYDCFNFARRGRSGRVNLKIVFGRFSKMIGLQPEGGYRYERVQAVGNRAQMAKILGRT